MQNQDFASRTMISVAGNHNHIWIYVLWSPMKCWNSSCRIIKRKAMLLLGLVLSSLASLGFALSVYIPTKHRLLFSILCLSLRVVNGMGAAAVDTSSMAICSEWVTNTLLRWHTSTSLGGLPYPLWQIASFLQVLPCNSWGVSYLLKGNLRGMPRVGHCLFTVR